MAYNAGASSGNRKLIQSQTASNSASLTFTTGITGYDVYYMDFYDVIVQVNGTLVIQYSTDGGSTYVTTGYLTEGSQSRSGAGIINIDAAFTGVCLSNALDAASSEPGAGYCYLYGLTNSAIQKYAIVNSCGIIAGVFGAFAFATNQTSTTVVNAMRVISLTGNITSGTFKLYGIQN